MNSQELINIILKKEATIERLKQILVAQNLVDEVYDLE